jgi:hypothetical protein
MLLASVIGMKNDPILFNTIVHKRIFGSITYKSSRDKNRTNENKYVPNELEYSSWNAKHCQYLCTTDFSQIHEFSENYLLLH